MSRRGRRSLRLRRRPSASSPAKRSSLDTGELPQRAAVRRRCGRSPSASASIATATIIDTQYSLVSREDAYVSRGITVAANPNPFFGWPGQYDQRPGQYYQDKVDAIRTADTDAWCAIRAAASIGAAADEATRIRGRRIRGFRHRRARSLRSRVSSSAALSTRAICGAGADTIERFHHAQPNPVAADAGGRGHRSGGERARQGAGIHDRGYHCAGGDGGRSAQAEDIKFLDRPRRGSDRPDAGLIRFEDWAQARPIEKQLLSPYPSYVEPNTDVMVDGVRKRFKEKLHMYVGQARFAVARAPDRSILRASCRCPSSNAAIPRSSTASLPRRRQSSKNPRTAHNQHPLRRWCEMRPVTICIRSRYQFEGKLPIGIQIANKLRDAPKRIADHLEFESELTLRPPAEVTELAPGERDRH